MKQNQSERQLLFSITYSTNHERFYICSICAVLFYRVSECNWSCIFTADFTSGSQHVLHLFSMECWGMAEVVLNPSLPQTSHDFRQVTLYHGSSLVKWATPLPSSEKVSWEVQQRCWDTNTVMLSHKVPDFTLHSPRGVRYGKTEVYWNAYLQTEHSKTHVFKMSSSRAYSIEVFWN